MKSEWRKVNLGDVCDLIPGFAFKSKDFGSYPTKVVKIGDIQPPRVAINCLEGVNLSSYSPNKLEKYLVTKGDFVLAMTGATIGKLGRFLADKPAYINQRVLRFKPKENVDWNFIYYVVNTKDFSGFVYNHIDSETAQPNISAGTLATFSFSIPPLPIQRKIASILSALDDKIETNNAICRNLEEQAMAVFKRCFFTYSEQLVEDKPVYDFAEYINGAAFKQYEYGESGLPIIKIAELKSGLSSSTLFYRGEDKDEKYYIQNGDILFSWSGNPETSIDVFIWTQGDAILNQHIFNVKSRCEAKWFTYLMLKNYMPVFAKIASDKQTTGLGHVTVADLKRLTFPYNINQILDFEKEVSIYMEQVYNTLVMNNHLSNLRDTLLPKLMSGELSIDAIN